LELSLKLDALSSYEYLLMGDGKLNWVGKPVARKNALGKVAGETRYAGEIIVPGGPMS
jgi:hypothetical protein